MKMLFAPRHLEEGQNVPRLRQIVAEFPVPSAEAEIRVIQLFRDQPVKIALVVSKNAKVTSEMPKQWLYEDVSDAELRKKVSELFRVDGPVSGSAAR